MSNETAVQKIPEAKVGDHGIEIQTLEQLWWMANRIAQSGMMPKGCQNVSSLVVRAQYGMSVGLGFMQSIQAVADINGRPSVWGKHVKGLIMASGKCESWKEEIVGSDPFKDDYTVRITSSRKDIKDEAVVEFSTAHARRAGLMDKDLYKKYPEDMIRHKAVARMADRLYPDVLAGLSVAEDIQDAIDITSTAEVINEPVRTLDDVVERVKRGRKPKASETVAEPVVEAQVETEVVEPQEDDDDAPII